LPEKEFKKEWAEGVTEKQMLSIRKNVQGELKTIRFHPESPKKGDDYIQKKKKKKKKKNKGGGGDFTVQVELGREATASKHTPGSGGS